MREFNVKYEIVADKSSKIAQRIARILKKAYTITFFQADGSYDIRDFLNKINKIIEKDEVFALICRSGHRSKIVSKFLNKNGHKVINLVGGMNYSIKKLGLPVKKYIGNRF